MANEKGRGGEQQQQQQRVSVVSCGRALEVAADTNASPEARRQLANHLAIAPEGCDCAEQILKGYRAFLAAAKAAQEGAKPKPEEGKQEERQEEAPLLKRLDSWGKRFFG